MSNLIPGNHKHLTLDDRRFIENALNEGRSFQDIARYLCKDPSTISKEVRLHRMADLYHIGSFNNPSNFCIHRFHCRRKNVCDKAVEVHDRFCRSCSICNQKCPAFERERCSRLSRPPYVCNGCEKKRSRCTISQKHVYDAAFAQRKYEQSLVSHRCGVNLTAKERQHLDQVVTPLIRQGQSPYQILINHPELGISVRTLYTYINDGVLHARNLDLKRKVKFKPRKCHKSQITDRSVFVGRTFSDFQKLSPDHFIEMDTVHSSRDSKKCLLTFFFEREKLFLAYLLNRCTKGAVRAVFDRLERQLGTELFLSLFEVILTDRGGEFGDPVRLETGIHGIQRTSIYYCDPMRSGQKGGIEQAHTMLRNVLPKGTSFSFLTQWDVNKIVNHMNSTPKAVINGSTPFITASDTLGADALSALRLKQIPPDEVNLTPALIHFNH